MAEPPPQIVVDALMAPTTRVNRRVEIYESDGVTRWNADNIVRFIDGTVTFDYTRSERGALDLTLDNSDGKLVHAPGYFWYDKIIKIFHGVTVRQGAKVPSVIIVGGTDDNNIPFRSALLAAGFDDVRINSLASTLADVEGYDIVASIGGLEVFPEVDLVNDAYNAGYSVFTQSVGVDETHVPFLTTVEAVEDRDFWAIVPNTSMPSALTYGWFSEEYPGTSGTFPTVIAAGSIAISQTAVDDLGVDTGYTIVGAKNTNGREGKWIHLHVQPDSYTANLVSFLKVGFVWLDKFVPMDKWEMQLGEYMIDKFGEDHFPHQIKISGRDYTKKCEGSEFEFSEIIEGPNALEDLVGDIAANAGITKLLLPPTGVTVNRTFSYDRGATRWSAMTEIANAYNYDVYFDFQGYLRLEPFRDPATSQPVHTFLTGVTGNLASYSKSTDDTRIYNHVIVVGDSQDSSALPPVAQALNTDPNSPTSIAKIGDRLYEYDSDFIETTEQAQAVADSFLAVHSLEQFNLDFSSIVFAWLEVGSIILFQDPNPAPGDPDMFLLLNTSIPMGLGPMSASAARVVLVG